MKNLLFLSVLAATLAVHSETVARYDLTFAFKASPAAPQGAAKWSKDLFASPDAVNARAVAGPLDAIRRSEVERWHRLGARVYAELPAEGTRTNAVKAYLTGFDGLVAASSADLAEALKDIAALSRMNELSRKAWKMTEPDKVNLDGRMGLFQLDRVDVASDDLDVVRLEAYARIRRLAALVKEPEGLAFDLKLAERPPLKLQMPPTKKRGVTTREDIVAALMDPKYVAAWDKAFWKYQILLSRADAEKHIGYPNPGIETFCWREYASEKLFMERRFELLTRKYAKTVGLLRYDRKNKEARPKILKEEEADIEAAYKLLPALANVVEEARRLRVAYYLDRFAGRPIEPLPPLVEKKKVKLDLEAGEDLMSEVEEL